MIENIVAWIIVIFAMFGFSTLSFWCLDKIQDIIAHKRNKSYKFTAEEIGICRNCNSLIYTMGIEGKEIDIIEKELQSGKEIVVLPGDYTMQFIEHCKFCNELKEQK